MNEQAYEAIAHNLADVFENGPRLSWDRKTAEIAIDRKAKRVLTTGLGCMGVGEMWVDYEEERPEWAGLPEQDSGDFGALALANAQVEVKVMSYHVPMTREAVDDSMILPPGVNIFDHLAEQERQFKALPPEEQARILAEEAERRAREKAERTCTHCGCDPDEHGGC